MVKAPIYTKTAKLNEGIILVDQLKQQWTIGPSVGQGGFGCIYSAKSPTSQMFDKVIKIEPSTNGPLFTEINFYKRAAKEANINQWIKENKLSFLGMPKYISCGLYEENRFLVMDRFGEDLHKSLMKNRFSTVCLLQISINILDVLEYIHSMEYAHADIKALNIMRGYTTASDIYLLDFGMVSKFSEKGQHREEKIDPKCKNNGTIEFSPRDSHTGLQPSRRGDIESLLYNILFWVTWDEKNPNSSRSVGFGRLPWLSFLQGLNSEKVSVSIINEVAQSKYKYMEDPKRLVEFVGLHKHSWSKHLVKMLIEVAKYKYDEKPDYDGLRKNLSLIISEILKKPSSVNDNRKINWNLNLPVENLETSKNLRKRPSYEIEDITQDFANKKKRGNTTKVLNTNDGVINSLKSEFKDKIKKVSNASKYLLYKPESEILEEPKKVMRKKKEIIVRDSKKLQKTLILNESSSKENYSEVDNDSLICDSKQPNEMIEEKTTYVDSKNISSLKEVIPGKKQLDQLVKKRKGKVAIVRDNNSIKENLLVAESSTSQSVIIPGLKALQNLKKRNEIISVPTIIQNSPKKTNDIIPGLKNLKRFNKRKKSLPISTSVSCQTTPTISKKKGV